MLEPSTARKLKALRAGLRKLSPGAIAVSGGLDSRLLAHLAWDLDLDFTAVFFQGPHMTAAEAAACRVWLERRCRPFHVLDFDPLAIPALRANHRDRCYHCKLAAFVRAKSLCRELEITHLLEGSNATDLTAFRPGRRALVELGVHSPLADHGLSKEELRHIAWSLGLESPGQPSRACLMTRFEYGFEPDREHMIRIGRAEDNLTALGFAHFRLRALRGGLFTLQLGMTEEQAWKQIGERGLACLRLEGIDYPTILWSKNVSGFFDGQS